MGIKQAKEIERGSHTASLVQVQWLNYVASVDGRGEDGA